jgi:hypothetical protein
MHVRGHATAGIDPDLDVEDLAAVRIRRPAELKSLSQYRILDHKLVFTRIVPRDR